MDVRLFAPAVLALVSATSLAAAEDSPAAALDAKLRAHVEAVYKADDATYLPTLSADAIVLVDGQVAKTATEVAAWFFGMAETGTYKLAPPTISVDPVTKIGWFHAAIAFTNDYKAIPGEQKAKSIRLNGRIVGVAIDDKGWKLATVMYTQTRSDKELIGLQGNGDTVTTREPFGFGATTHDATLGKLVTTWITSGTLAKSAAKATTVTASGSSPAEYKTGAGAITLAKSWDALKLKPGEVVTKTWASGAIGWVWMRVDLPIKGRTPLQLTLGALVVKEATGWRWLALSFSG